MSTEKEGVSYLERAKSVLFQRFCAEVLDGEYDKAAVLVSLMQELSIV